MKVFLFDFLVFRARTINTQLGKEEYSAYVRVHITGDPTKEIAPEIIVKPQDTTIIKDQQLAELHCISNAR